MLDRWLERDDLSDDDLRELTAEEEVMDLMTGSPLPAVPRPDWLHDGEPWKVVPVRHARALPPPPSPTGPPWALAVAGAFAVAGLGAVGLVGAALVALAFLG